MSSAARDFYLRRGETPAWSMTKPNEKSRIPLRSLSCDSVQGGRRAKRKRHFVLSGVSSTWCRARDDDKSCNYILKVNCTSSMFGVSRANWMRSSRRRLIFSFFFVCQQRFLMPRLPYAVVVSSYNRKLISDSVSFRKKPLRCLSVSCTIFYENENDATNILITLTSLSRAS